MQSFLSTIAPKIAANFLTAHYLEALGRHFPDDLGGRPESGVHLGLQPPVAAGVGIEAPLSALRPNGLVGTRNQDTWRRPDLVVRSVQRW